MTTEGFPSDRIAGLALVLALRARIAELEAAQTPQPIETAPRDGTRILVEVYDASAPLASKWRWYTGIWDEGFIEEDSAPDKPTFGWWRDDGSDEPIEPTRWRPMPPAPEVTQ